MSDMKDFLRDAGYFGVGAAAVIIETGAKAVKALVKKGEQTLRDNQDTVDELKRRAKEAGDRIKDAVDRATAQPEESAEDGPVAPDAIYHTDEPVPDEPVAEEPIVEEPTVEEPVVEEPMVEEPVAPAEKPEETING